MTRKASVDKKPSPISYCCSKCSNTSSSGEEVHLTGKYGRFFNLQSKKFIAVTCENCGYVDFYRMQSGRAGNILDVLGGG